MTSIDQAFLRDFLSNLLATLAGAVIGIPIALWIARKLEQRGEQREGLAETVTLHKMLELLKAELEQDRDKIKYIRNQTIDLIAALELAVRLRDEAWTSLSRSGRLRLIDDLDLLSALSKAYASIQELVYVGRNYFSAGDIVRQRGSLQFSTFFDGFKTGGLGNSEEQIDVALAAVASWKQNNPLK